MKEALVTPNLQVEIRDVPVPVPKAGEVLVKVAVSGTNPKDWKVPGFLQKALNSGDDLAGIVEAVGAGVSDFKPGDRVAGMHQIGADHGSFAEYSISAASTTFHIPDHISFEEAVTIPLTGLVAAFGLYHVLRLPAPWAPAGIETGPLIIHGAGTAIGAFVLKLARAAGISPIIATAGKSRDLVRGLLDFEQGDILIDYQQPREKLVTDIQSAITEAGKGPAWHGFDAVTNQDGASEYTGVLKDVLGSQAGLTDSSERKPVIATVQAGAQFTGSVAGGAINVMLAHTGTNEEKCLANTASRLFTYGLASGWLTGHPTEVVGGGLEGLGDALQRLKAGQVFGKKLIINVNQL